MADICKVFVKNMSMFAVSADCLSDLNYRIPAQKSKLNTYKQVCYAIIGAYSVLHTFLLCLRKLCVIIGVNCDIFPAEITAIAKIGRFSNAKVNTDSMLFG